VVNLKLTDKYRVKSYEVHRVECQICNVGKMHGIEW
jgi:hypothetical protein